MRRTFLVFLFLGLACGGGEEPQPGEPGPIVYGQIESEAEPRPARFDAPLPETAEGMAQLGDTHPPAEWLSVRACAGDERVLNELIRAHRVAAVEGLDAEVAYAQPVSWCQDPAFCTRVRPRFDTSEGADRVLLAQFLAHCPGNLDVFEALDLPDTLILRRHSGYSEDEPIYSPRLAQALRRLPADPGYDARMAAVRHGEIQDERVAADLVAAYDRVTDEHTLGGIAAGMRDQPGAPAASRLGAWCADRPEDYACRPRYEHTGWEEEPPPPASPEALRLVALGLAEPGLYATDGHTLGAFGAHYFDTETGMFPNGHDGLLAGLALRGGPDFADAVFSELPPADPGEMRELKRDDGTSVHVASLGTDQDYILSGWMGGKRWSVRADDLGDWYDVGAAMSLMNTMARDSGSSVRFVAVHTGDQMSSVLAGDETALMTAIDEGLIQVIDAGGATDAARELEEEFFRQLQSGEVEL